MDNSSTEEKTTKPEPSDFDSYLPYACKELQVNAMILITKTQSVEKTTRQSMRLRKSLIMRPKLDLIDTKIVKSFKSIRSTYEYKTEIHNAVKINSVYDALGNLTQLTFDKNKKIPKDLFKVIGLFIHYHTCLMKVTINSGLDHACLYELNKLVILANITDLCLDNTASGGNYDILLEDKDNKLKNLSIARCNIDDKTVKKMAINLTYPLPSSQNLSVLNLASNLITDAGAKYLAVALRTNRQLAYLNLSDNNITDEGAQEIFDVLIDFLLTEEEMFTLRQRNVQYMKERNCLIEQIAEELKNADCQEKTSKKKLVKPNSAATPSASSKKGHEKDLLKTPVNKSNMDLDSIWVKKAKILANERMGSFVDPYAEENVNFKDNRTYCYGNNNLAYINISYNDISHYTVKKILTVLLTQQKMNRTPRGLVNVSLEGNNIPPKCGELEEIDRILTSYLVQRRMTVFKLRK